MKNSPELIANFVSLFILIPISIYSSLSLIMPAAYFVNIKYPFHYGQTILANSFIERTNSI